MNVPPGSSGAHDWRIKEVSTEIIVTESAGSLGPEDIRKIAAVVLEHLRQEQHRAAGRERDAAITDRAYQPDVE